VRAITFSRPGGVEVLELAERSAPVAAPGQVLVAVEVAGLNFIDTYHRTGLYPLPLPSGLGLEGAGTVVAVGEGVTDRQVGQRVAWADTLGSYAEQVAVSAARTVVVPDGLDPATACALMLQGMTAHYLAFSTFALGKEHTALVYAAAGGVGRLLVQLALQRGARVIACTSTADKEQDVRSLGAHEVVQYRDVDVAATVRDLTGGAGVDVAYDSIGAATWEATLDSLKPRGMAVFYGSASGPVPAFDLSVLMAKGSLFATRPKMGDYLATGEEIAWRAGSLFSLATAGHLDVRIHGRYPLADVARAHTDLESGTTSGKLLLEV